MAENYENSPNLITEDVLALESVVSELEVLYWSENLFNFSPLGNKTSIRKRIPLQTKRRARKN